MASDQPDLQRAQTFFKYGNEAALKGNHDYAINMYKQASTIVLDNLLYRQALRGIETAQVQQRSRQGGHAGRCQEPADPVARKNARSKQKFAEAIELCEDAFVNNPWDVGAARVAAEAAEGLEFLLARGVVR